MYQNGWNFIKSHKFMPKMFNILKMQFENLGKPYTIYQNAF
jgi:hypothetical protein